MEIGESLFKDIAWDAPPPPWSKVTSYLGHPSAVFFLFSVCHNAHALLVVSFPLSLCRRGSSACVHAHPTQECYVTLNLTLLSFVTLNLTLFKFVTLNLTLFRLVTLNLTLIRFVTLNLTLFRLVTLNLTLFRFSKFWEKNGLVIVKAGVVCHPADTAIAVPCLQGCGRVRCQQCRYKKQQV